MDPLSAFNQSPIKGTFFIHFMLITCSLITLSWLPEIFLFYNMLFFICLFWSLHAPQNQEPVQMAAIINLLSILLDIMCISTNYNLHSYLGWFGFSLFLIICNLIIRPVTSFVLLRVSNERNFRFGSHGTSFPFDQPSPVIGDRENRFAGTTHNGYQDLDSTMIPPTVLPGATSSQAGSMPYQSVPSPIHRPQQLVDTK